MTKEYEIFFALKDDLNEGWVWIREPELKGRQGRRPIAHITMISNTRKKRSIYCEVLYAEKIHLFMMEERLKTQQIIHYSHLSSDRNLQKAIDLLNAALSGIMCYNIPPDPPKIFMSEWYRRRLGIENIGDLPNMRVTLRVRYDYCPLRWWYQLHACLQHPQASVFVATVFAIIGTALGFIGMGVGLAALPTDNWHMNLPWIPVLGIILFVIGIVVFGYGLYAFYER